MKNLNITEKTKVIILLEKAIKENKSLIKTLDKSDYFTTYLEKEIKDLENIMNKINAK